MVRSKWFTDADAENADRFAGRFGDRGKVVEGFILAAEQKLNAKFVVDVVHVGLRVRPKDDDVDKKGVGGLVMSEDVEMLTIHPPLSTMLTINRWT